MIKTVGIVSLSSGIIGEEFIQFEVEIGLRRLREYGLKVKFMPNALKGIDYIREHPVKRAEDLLQAFRDPEIDMILCAIGCCRICLTIMSCGRPFPRRFSLDSPIPPSTTLCCTRWG